MLPLLLGIHLELLIVATQLSKLSKSTQARSHGNNVSDVIIVHVISADAHTDAETAK